jgi:hypothetical protein
MTHRNTMRAGLALLTAFMLVGGFTLPAGAVKWFEQPLLPWESEALKAFDRNDYDKAMEIARNAERDPNRNAKLIIYYCQCQKYYLERDKNAALHYKQYYETTKKMLTGSNLPVLTRLVVMPSVSWNTKVNKPYLDAAFEAAHSEEHLGTILFYLESQEPDIAKGALVGLKTILQKKRNLVMNGGTLSAEDRAWMSDERMLKLLVRMTGEGMNPVAGFMSKLPAVARQKAITGAPACLGLIEDPALPLLKEAAAMGNANAAAAIQLIQDARGARLAKWPNSTWYSAQGK